MQRLRVRFTRGEEVKYISHLDIMRLWERALNRAGIHVAYSEGFSPHPRLSLAAPLAVGVTAEAELLDIFLADNATPHWFTDVVGNQLPKGIRIQGVQQISILVPSLQSQVRSADYIVVVETGGLSEDIGSAIKSLLSKDKLSWYHERDTGRREYDLRVLIDDIRLVSSDTESCTLSMRLHCDSNGSGRPEQVTRALGFTGYPLSILRTRLILGN
jgi:radical SAM-linked protein